MKSKTVAGVLRKVFNEPLPNLSQELREVAEAYIPNWSELSASERAERAAEIDRQRDLKMQIKLARVTKENDRRKSDSSAIKEDSLLFDGFAAIDDIEREIREIELMPASIPSEYELKARLLADAMQRHHHAKLQQDELQKDMLRQHWCELAEMPSLSVLHWIELTKIAVGNINSCWEVKSSGVFPVIHSEDDIALLRDDMDSQRALLEYQQRQPLLFPCSPMQLIQFIDGDLAGNFAIPKEFRDAVVRSPECLVKSHGAQQIQQSIDRKEARIPAPLFGEGFSEEARKTTTLTRWLEFETWPAMWASLLVCGIQPPDQSEFDVMPEKGAFGLDGSLRMGNEDCFHEAKRILALWKCRADVPAMVRPDEFIAWCKTKGINTEWLKSIDQLAADSMSNADAQSNRIARQQITLTCTKQELIDGFVLTDKKWEDILSRPNKYKDALAQAGRKGRGGAALWWPIVFARLLIENDDLNRGQVAQRFKKAWGKWEAEMLAEIGDI